MFDNLKGMASLAGLMKDLPKLKAQMEDVKERLGRITVDAETGAGAVRVRANGHLRLVSLTIDPAMLAGLVDTTSADDRTMAEDLIMGAVNTALEKARDAAAEEMRGAAADLGLPLPPGGLEGLLP